MKLWTAEQTRRTAGDSDSGGGDQGVVTQAGNPSGVYLDGERRWIPVYAPSGYHWCPQVGQSVLVMKAGECRFVVGAAQSERTVEPGEIALTAGESEIFLAPDGTLALTGTVTINGQSLETMVRTLVSEMAEEESV